MRCSLGRSIHLLDILADYGIVARAQARGKLQVHRRVVNLVNLYGHYLLQLLHLLLHLHGLGGLVAEALYEGFHVLYLLLLVLVSPQLLFAALTSQHHILIIFHLVVYDTAT